MEEHTILVRKSLSVASLVDCIRSLGIPRSRQHGHKIGCYRSVAVLLTLRLDSESSVEQVQSRIGTFST